MKKLSLFMGMALAASLSLTNCTEKIEGPITPATPAGIPFEISADISTKTTNDGLATNWAEGDAINLFHAEASTAEYVSDNDFILDATREGVFKGNLTGTLDPSKSYDWYAIYPYNKALTTPAARESGWLLLGQTKSETFSITQTGNDSKAHLCGKALPLYGVAKGVASDVKPAVTMNNLASVVAVRVKNTTTEPLLVKSVSFTSTEDIVGTYYIDFTGENVVYTGSGDKYVSATASLTVNNGEAIAPNSEATFYIPIKPHTVAKDATLKISVNGYEKPLTLPKEVTFTAGKIKTLAFKYDNTSVVSQATFDFSSKESIASMGIDVPATSNGTNISSKTLTVGAVSMTSTDGGTATRVWNSKGSYDLRVYAKKENTADGSLTFKVPAGYLITKVVFNGTALLSVTEGSYTDNVWKGSTQSVTFTATKTCKITAVDVFYEVGEVKPLISATDITGISARGESAGELVYTIENPVEGTTLSGSCDGTVVTSVIDHGDGKTFLYEVSKNLGVAREGWIKLTYGDVEKTVKVSQNAPVFKSSRTSVELDAVAGASTAITMTSDFNWISESSAGAGFTVSPETYTWAGDGKQTVTITANAANDSEEGVRTLGTVTFTDLETFEEIVVSVKQKSSYIAVGPTSITFTPANFTGGTSGTGGATNSLIEGVKVYTDKGFIDGTTAIRVYANGIITISSETKTIKKIEFTSTVSDSNKYGPSNLSLQGNVGSSSYSGKVTTWTGSSNSVSYEATKQYRFTKIVVTYE